MPGIDTCKHCSAWLLKTCAYGKTVTETCHCGQKGKYAKNPAGPPPSELAVLLSTGHLQKSALRINDSLGMLAVTMPRGEIARNQPIAVWTNRAWRIGGSTYARVLQENHTNSAISLLLCAPADRYNSIAKKTPFGQPGVDADIVKQVDKILNRTHPLLQGFVKMRDYNDVAEQEVRLTLTQETSQERRDQVQFSLLTMPSAAIPAPRQLVYYKKSNINEKEAYIIDGHWLL